jgi:hypothetical protein
MDLTKSTLPKRTSSRTVKTATTDQEIVELVQSDFSAELTNEHVQEYESTQNKIWGDRRRLTMTSLTQSKKQLIDTFGDGNSPDLVLGFVEIVNEWRDHMLCHVEVAEVAAARLLSVANAIICRNKKPQEHQHDRPDHFPSPCMTKTDKSDWKGV